MSKVKIFHYADLQLEIRTSGTGSQRLDEFSRSLKLVEIEIKKSNPDIVIIPGDIFEFHDSNAEEKKLFSQHLHNIIPLTTRIVIIPGNHDVRQRGIALTSVGEKRNLTDEIDATITAINSDKISYYQKTGLYKDPIFDITYAVWSQWDKHSMSDSKPPYSPWSQNSLEDVTTKGLIELFHDPIQGCKDFSGEPSKLFSEYKITLADFKAPTIIAGDIHSPDIIWFGENKDRLFTYSSSLIQRNFGEGDYWNDLERRIAGNMQHGYNVIEFDIESNRAISCEFFRLDPIISRHTINLSKKFNYDTMIPALEIDASEFNKIRVVCQGNLKSFIEHEGEIIQHFQDNYHCSIELDHAKDILDIQIDESEFEDISQAIDKDKMLSISKRYIETIVDKTGTIDIKDKEEAKDYIYKLFEEQLAEVDLTTQRVDIRPVRAKISNFMSFGDEVKIDFKDDPLTVISGTNKVGKTTIIHFFKWMWADKITDNQNDRNKKYNYSLLFNDSSELDVVLGEVDMFINGKLHTINKSLTRNWKKGKKDIENENWIEELKGTPEMQLSIKSQEFNSDNTEECMEYLAKLFTYDELDKLMFVNSVSLDNLVDQKSEDLAALFLSFLGLDALNNILDKFDDLKDEKLSKLTKPALTVEQASEQIAQLEHEIEDLYVLDQKLDLDIHRQEGVMKSTQSMVDELRSKIHQVQTITEITQQLDDIEYEYKSNESNSKEINEKIDLLRQEKQSSDRESITTLKHQSELELSKIEHSQSNNKAEQTRQIERINDAKDHSRQIVVDVKNKLSAEINQWKVERGDIADKLSDNFYSKQIEIKRAYNQELAKKRDKLVSENSEINTTIDQAKTQIDEQNGWKNNFTQSISLAEQEITNQNSKVAELTHSKSCPTCKRLLEDDAVKIINDQVTQILTGIIPEQEEKIKTAKENLTKSDDKISKIQSIIDVNIESKNANQDRQKRLQQLIDADEISMDENPEAAEKFATIQKDIDVMVAQRSELEQKINKAEAELPQKVKESPEIQEAIVNIGKLKTILESLETTAAEIVLEYDKKKAEIDDLVSKLERIQKIDDQIVKVEEYQKQNIAKFEEIKQQEKDLKKSEKFALENVETDKKIKDLINKLLEEKSALEKIQLEKSTISKEEHTIKTNMDILKTTIEDIRAYKIIDSSLKLYKKLLGKNGLPQYIFAHLIPLINKRLNESLEGVDFRLIFDKDSIQLRFIDLKKNISRPVSFISGMEKTVCGICLTNILRIMNNSKVFSILFIDEISGKLNNGKKLSYEAKNYQKLMQEFIVNLSKSVNIYIVDHVLEFDKARIIEVCPSDKGSVILQN